MPVQTTYPGVYIEEIPSGNFTITGVSTSITAFIGRAAMGLSNTPTVCFSFADFETFFGGRGHDYPMSYAVEDFFLNGGSEAIVTRVETTAPSATLIASDAAAILNAATTAKAEADAAVTAANDAVTAATAADSSNSTAATKRAVTDAQAKATAATAAQTTAATNLTNATAYNRAAQTAAGSGKTADLVSAYAAGATAGSTLAPNPPPAVIAAPATAALTTGATGLTLSASSNGTWGNNITATIDSIGITDTVAKVYGSTAANSFNLTLAYTKPNNTVVVERFTAVNVDNTPFRLDRVLAQQSNLATLAWPAGGGAVAKPSDTPVATSGPGAGKPTPTTFAGGVDGGYLTSNDIIGDQQARTGLFALEHTDLFNLLCIPWDQRKQDLASTVHAAAAAYCVSRRAMYIVDSPQKWADLATVGQISQIDPNAAVTGVPTADIGLGITDAAEQRNSMVYFPKVLKADLEMGGQIDVFPACGIIAGQIAQTDATRGVWKAPAGIAVGLGGITGLEFNLTDQQQGQLNPIGINCLRSFRVLGPLIWGARTLRGADLMSDDYKYVPVRRLTLYIEESLYRGTKFAVFEPNDETLWSQLRLTVGAFMADLARQGAFYGYQVLCDATTTTANDIAHGVCNVVVAFAPVKPAEFIVLQIQQQAGQTAA
jgi:phage tail sheath protein FI